MTVSVQLLEFAGQLETQAGRPELRQSPAAQVMRQGGTLLRKAVGEFEALQASLDAVTEERDALLEAQEATGT